MKTIQKLQRETLIRLIAGTASFCKPKVSITSTTKPVTSTTSTVKPDTTCQCGMEVDPRQHPKIIGGDQVPRVTDFPWMVNNSH